jgi:hypothetical protein
MKKPHRDHLVSHTNERIDAHGALPTARAKE